ncbi:unnamed protein product [Vicia faba]|uniref:Uncharacterized protein n=1 Tax=Vicia faba TaxID=3906 RepID=A0AAV0ZE82_VICFA|nr:unnamed protein product [Vicia faba]
MGNPRTAENPQPTRPTSNPLRNNIATKAPPLMNSVPLPVNHHLQTDVLQIRTTSSRPDRRLQLYLRSPLKVQPRLPPSVKSTNKRILSTI